MEGYYLFRGDTLIAHNPTEEGQNAMGLHDKGQAGDTLVRIYPWKIHTYEWVKPTSVGGEFWGVRQEDPSNKYRILALLQT